MIPERSESDQHIAIAKEERLIAWLRERESVLIGFSGGVDSAYLATVAVRALGGERVVAVIGRSASYPADQLEAARAVGAACGVPIVEVATGELDDPRYAANPVNRCYFCKSELWHVLRPVAQGRGIATVVDGTNADDLGEYRPGARAAEEQGIESPLALLAFSKEEIRARSRALGVPGWDRPPSPCLSSRLPYGSPVTSERLRQVEAAERGLRALGIEGNLRVRHHGALARVEMSASEIAFWLRPANAERLREAVLYAGFARVCVDLAGFRSGSLNVLSGVSAA